MNIRLLKLCICLSILNISYSNACHDSGDSHCKADTGSSYSAESNNQNHELQNKLNFNENGDSDPKGFFDNNPYDKENLNKISKNSSLEKIKTIPEVNSILTSGGKSNAKDGHKIIQRMIDLAEDKIKIIAAGGITDQNFEELHNMIGAKEYHGKRIVGHLT